MQILKTFVFLGVFAFTLTAVGQESGGGQGSQSEACRAYANASSSTMTGGTMMGGSMTGGTMTGGTMTGGAMGSSGTTVQASQVQEAIQSAVSCLGELRSDIESGQNAEQAALALFNIREDLDRAFQAAQMVEESSESLAELELLQQQVSEQREEALASLDQVTQNLSALSTSEGASGNTMTGGAQ